MSATLWFPISVHPATDDRWRLRCLKDPALRVRVEGRTYYADDVPDDLPRFVPVAVLREMTPEAAFTLMFTESTDEQFERLLEVVRETP